jgi:hypothetical protein
MYTTYTQYVLKRVCVCVFVSRKLYYNKHVYDVNTISIIFSKKNGQLL